MSREKIGPGELGTLVLRVGDMNRGLTHEDTAEPRRLFGEYLECLEAVDGRLVSELHLLHERDQNLGPMLGALTGNMWEHGCNT